MGDHRLVEVQMQKVLTEFSKKMFKNYELSGTVNGGGFDCRDGNISNKVEQREDGYWNKVNTTH